MAVEGWITLDKAKELFKAAGREFGTLKQAAARRDFKPELLGGTARFAVTNSLREVKSKNVVARIEGIDPAPQERDGDLYGSLGSPRARPGT